MKREQEIQIIILDESNSPRLFPETSTPHRWQVSGGTRLVVLCSWLPLHKSLRTSLLQVPGEFEYWDPEMQCMHKLFNLIMAL